jgi:hypothetical protein
MLFLNMVSLIMASTCSFSFEEALISQKIPVRNLERNKNVSMYVTHVACIAAGAVPAVPLVVSLRPIPCHQLAEVFAVTSAFVDAHGAPIHVGSPRLLGIPDVTQPDFGEAPDFEEGDVPVFWCCGVTNQSIVKAMKAPLAFTHSPGCMFLCDVPSDEISTFVPKTPLQNSPGAPRVFQIASNPLHFSVVGGKALHLIQALETLCQEDPGNRGIASLCLKDQLIKAALSLSHSKAVLIITGFPCHFTQAVPEETDGPPSAILLAETLQNLGKSVSLLIDKRATPMLRHAVEDAVKKGIIKQNINIEVYEGNTEEDAKAFLNPEKKKKRFDHLVAVERAGRAEDGHHYTMKGVSVSHLVDPLDDLFVAANQLGIATTGVGDGGNELGTGSVKEKTKQSIENGALIACNVEADFTVFAGAQRLNVWQFCDRLTLVTPK